MFTSIVFVVVLKNNEYSVCEFSIAEYLKYRNNKWFMSHFISSYDSSEDAYEHAHFANYELWCMNRA